MENEFHRWLKHRLPIAERMHVGIGDDAAWLNWPDAELVITSDMLADGTHFDWSIDGAPRVGRKCLAANLSDLAAMAATPIAVVVSLLMPGAHADQLARELIGGMCPLADQFAVAIAGGDTNTWEGPLVANVTAVGSMCGRQGLRRDAAQAHDIVMVTGDLGGSRLGKHLDFSPRIDEAQRLHDLGVVAAMDISDGLSLDALRMAESSQIGIAFDLNDIPISQAAHQWAAQTGRSPLACALGDGEDFELLFTVNPAKMDALLTAWDLDTRLTAIGLCVDDPGIWVSSKAGLTPLDPTGYEHQ